MHIGQKNNYVDKKVIDFISIKLRQLTVTDDNSDWNNINVKYELTRCDNYRSL